MHDLNTIRRLNFEAFADSIGRYQRQGRWVLATYEGLHLTSIETFSSAEDAAQALVSAQESAPIGNTFRLFKPIEQQGAP